MVQEKIRVLTQTLKWKCVESREINKRLYYGCFILSPLMKGQADTIGIAMQKALPEKWREYVSLSLVQNLKKIPHEYFAIILKSRRILTG